MSNYNILGLYLKKKNNIFVLNNLKKMKVIFILFLVINNTLKHCQAEETVINSDACTAERLKVLLDIILITKYVDKNTLPTRKIVVEAFYFSSKISEITIF